MSAREGYIRIRRHRLDKEKAGASLQPEAASGKRARTTALLPREVVVSPAPVLAPSHCDAVILACERAATAGGGAGAWRASQSDAENSGYTQATADLELDAHREVRRALLGLGLGQRLSFSSKVDAHMATHHGRRIVAMDDCFIVK